MFEIKNRVGPATGAMRQRILVTGGGGFLGSHLVGELLSRGYEVLCVDNFFTGSKENLSDFLANPRFELIRHDIRKPLYVEVDKIYNLACPASPVHYQYNPVQTFNTSVVGSVNMLGLAKRVGARILQASTSEVYGDPAVHPQREDYWGNVNPIGVRSCYDEGKRAAESIFMDYKRQYGLDIAIARIFNTYGPRMHPNDGRVVSNFIVQGLLGKPITIYGDGKQTRSFCYVDDLITGLVSLMEANGFSGPVNLGNPEEITVLELAQAISELMGKKGEIIFRELPQDDPTRRSPDISVAKKELGWSPRIPLREGLLKTIAYFDDLLSKNRG